MAEKHRWTRLLACLLACLLAGRYSSIKLALVVVFWFVDLSVFWFVCSLVRRFVGVLVCWNWLNWQIWLKGLACLLACLLHHRKGRKEKAAPSKRGNRHHRPRGGGWTTTLLCLSPFSGADGFSSLLLVGAAFPSSSVGVVPFAPLGWCCLLLSLPACLLLLLLRIVMLSSLFSG